MRGSLLLASALAVLAGTAVQEAAAAWQRQEDGTSVETDDGEVEIGVWIEVGLPGAEPPAADPGDTTSPCHFRQGNYTELNAWLENDYVLVPDPDEVYIFNICENDGVAQLTTYWVYQPSPPQEPPPPTAVETTRLRNEAWGRLAIPDPITLTAPADVTIVQIPTYVWVPPADRSPVSETVATTLDGHELSLTATAYPRRLGFLRVDMGDGNTLWCDADEVAAFNHARDPLDQPSDCFYYYRHSSVNAPDLRYRMVLTAYWDVSVRCTFNGGPCANPPPAVPTQALTAPPHAIAVAEIQALARPG